MLDAKLFDAVILITFHTTVGCVNYIVSVHWFFLVSLFCSDKGCVKDRKKNNSGNRHNSSLLRLYDYPLRPSQAFTPPTRYCIIITEADCPTRVVLVSFRKSKHKAMGLLLLWSLHLSPRANLPSLAVIYLGCSGGKAFHLLNKVKGRRDTGV